MCGLFSADMAEIYFFEKWHFNGIFKIQLKRLYVNQFPLQSYSAFWGLRSKVHVTTFTCFMVTPPLGRPAAGWTGWLRLGNSLNTKISCNLQQHIKHNNTLSKCVIVPSRQLHTSPIQRAAFACNMVDVEQGGACGVLFYFFQLPVMQTGQFLFFHMRTCWRVQPPPAVFYQHSGLGN